MKIDEGKRLVITAANLLISALLIALNNKLALGLSEATVTAIAAQMGLAVGVYIWGQTRTDQTDTKTDGTSAAPTGDSK